MIHIRIRLYSEQIIFRLSLGDARNILNSFYLAMWKVPPSFSMLYLFSLHYEICCSDLSIKNYIITSLGKQHFFFFFFTQIVWLTWSKHTFSIKRVNRLVEFYFLLFISGVTVRITISTVLVFCIFYTSVNWLMKRIELLNIVCH